MAAVGVIHARTAARIKRRGILSRVTATTPICNRQSAIYNPQLFIRGHSSVGRAPALQAGSQGFESPCLQSTLAAVAESVDCRAVALAKADIFHLATHTQRATTRQAQNYGKILLRVHSGERNPAGPILYRPNGGSTETFESSQCRPRSPFF